MAFFKFRNTADASASSPTAAQSIETLRQRAKYRLLGASVLVLVGVIGFPLLFDKQPRPIAVDTPIEIPDRNKVAPLPGATQAVPVASAPLPTASVAVEPAATAVSPASAPELVKPRASASQSVVITETAQLPLVPASKAALTPISAAAEVAKPALPAISTTPARVTEAARAQAVLEGKVPDLVSATELRFVVQVGAFAENGRAQEVRHKLERAGLKTYTHVAEIKGGKRIRVRVGPFATKAEADKAAEKIKKINLPAAVLTLTR